MSYTEKIEFIIPDSGKHYTPFVDLHFYKWLTCNFRIKEKNITIIKEYLASQGFTKEHVLNAGDISLLKYCLDYWFYHVIVVDYEGFYGKIGN